jgi:hypothetical protein
LVGKYFDGFTNFYAGVAKRLGRTWLPVRHGQPDIAPTTRADRRKPTLHPAIQRIDLAFYYNVLVRVGQIVTIIWDSELSRYIVLAGRKNRRLNNLESH